MFNSPMDNSDGLAASKSTLYGFFFLTSLCSKSLPLFFS